MDRELQFLNNFRVKNIEELIHKLRKLVSFNSKKNSDRIKELENASKAVRVKLINESLAELYREKQSIKDNYLYPDNIITDDELWKQVIKNEIIGLCFNSDEEYGNEVFNKNEASRIIAIQVKRLINLNSIEQIESLPDFQRQNLENPNSTRGKSIKQVIKKPTQKQKNLINYLLLEIGKNPTISKTALASSAQTYKICSERTVFTFYNQIETDTIKENKFTAFYKEKFLSHK